VSPRLSSSFVPPCLAASLVPPIVPLRGDPKGGGAAFFCLTHDVSSFDTQEAPKHCAGPTAIPEDGRVQATGRAFLGSSNVPNKQGGCKHKRIHDVFDFSLVSWRKHRWPATSGKPYT
jgi:hypothetical protein